MNSYDKCVLLTLLGNTKIYIMETAVMVVDNPTDIFKSIFLRSYQCPETIIILGMITPEP